MGFMARANRQGIRAGAVVVAAAAAVAGTVWGVTALVEPGPGRQENAARQTDTGGTGAGSDDGAKDGGGRAVVPKAPEVPTPEHRSRRYPTA